ncbi:unnamed protein product [Zymoseptoria tritici ST99CH_1A5]|uniref:Calcium-dependent phosphotriesterase n=1 Tax=Zymoseptoria tritici ST99CH_1A5 TaxID=1276529 RepID=A0A1Y6LBJ6_ZYMTR|nr:unnamed protein product [Zymoseptoria tritici ST99CH_1A5]
MGGLTTLTGPLVALLSLFVYYRSNVFTTFYTNAPARLANIRAYDTFEVKFAEDVRNCEDVLLNEEAGWALFSCDPSRDGWNTVMANFVDSNASPKTGLYIYNYAEHPDTPPRQLKLSGSPDDAATLHPLGIEYHGESQTIFVANPSTLTSRIDVYHLELTDGVPPTEATFVRSIHDPVNIAAPNSIHALSATELLVTNNHFFQARQNPILAKIETYAAIPGGSVVHVQLHQNGSHSATPLVNMAFPNGIAQLNDSVIAVASSTLSAVRLYQLIRGSEGSATELTYLSQILVPFLPDNLSVTSNGKLLIAGHPHAPSLEILARKNGVCVGSAEVEEEVCKDARLSWIAEWSEKDGLRDLYVGKGYGTTTTAVRDERRGVGIAGGLYQEGILVWKE